MFLVAGLGNPGPKYAATRHNLGFMVADQLAERWGALPFREKWKGLYAKAPVGSSDVVVLKPMTYMNLSGECVQPAMTFFRVDLAHVIAVHDELDLPFGQLRIKVGGGTAGHNGLRSMVQHCGGPDFVRVRMGIGRPPKGGTESWVLGELPPSDRAELPDFVKRGADAVEAIVREGTGPAMNHWNQRP